jgi:predicted transcriptional regulator
MGTAMIIKDLIKEIRIKCCISQGKLAEWSGIDQTSLSYYERGKRKPGLMAIKKIIDVANERAGMSIKYTDIRDEE